MQVKDSIMVNVALSIAARELQAATAGSESVTVAVTGMKSDEGEVGCGLFRSAKAATLAPRFAGASFAAAADAPIRIQVELGR
jgi:uncharacterized protein (DUF2141 family)